MFEAGELLRYTGNGTDYSWDLVSYIGLSYNNNSAEISLPRQLVGNAGSLHLFFAGNHAAIGGDGNDYFPDGVTDTTLPRSDRYFVYSVSASTDVPPIANPKTLYMAQGDSVQIVLTGADANDDTLSFEVADLPQFGTLSGTAPNLTYLPQADFSGTDSFAFSVSDGSNSSAVARVTINVAPAVSPSIATITLDGDLSDWAAIGSLGEDPADVTGIRDTMDLARGWIAHDDNHTYFAYQDHDAPLQVNWGYGIYLDTDNDRSTGFRGFSDEFPIGADTIIEGFTLQQYTGTGLNWSWSEGKLLDYAQAGDVMELAVPQSDLGNVGELRFFMVADNMAVSGNALDYYPDTTVDTRAAQRYFSYRYAAPAPVAYGQTLQVASDATLTVELNSSVFASPVYTITALPQHGTLSGTAPNLVYQPDASYTGNDELQFTVSADGQTSAPAVVRIVVSESQATAPSVWSNPVATMQIDGSFSDWASVAPFNADGEDVSATGEKIDWNTASMAHSPTAIYLRVENTTAISALTWGHAVYLDTDASAATGFIGFSSELPGGSDYLIEGASLYRYSGSGSDWMWNYLGEVSAAVGANQYELEIERALIGNPDVVDLYLRGDNGAIATSNAIDFYPDGVTDIGVDISQRRFRYQTAR